MTRQEFDNQCWHARMECLIDGDTYPIVRVEMLTVPCKFVTIKQC